VILGLTGGSRGSAAHLALALPLPIVCPHRPDDRRHKKSSPSSIAIRFIPGDNEWTDYRRAKPRTYDPLERLTKLRQMFFQGAQSLGQRTMRLTRQSEDPPYAKFRENVCRTSGEVLFVTLHLVGSNNNLGRTPDMDAEHAEHHAADLARMSQAFELATRIRIGCGPLSILEIRKYLASDKRS